MNELLTKSIAVGVGTFLLDFAWAKYNIATAQKQVTRSAIYSVAIYLLSALVIMQYIDNHWLLIPASVGAFVGTGYSVWHEKRKGAS